MSRPMTGVPHALSTEALRVCFLDAGTIIEEGPPDRILRDPQEPLTRQFLQRVIDAGRL